ncbi:30S ribosomal protein S5 [Mycobacteroides abscessus subsp. abscessus]|nr:30S ribosomal protein S5 [Mycobacteroides abscessus subsp. abscessus]
MVEPVGNDLPDVLLGIDPGATLVDIAQLDGLAHLDLAAVGVLQPDDGLEQGGLADTVGADHADDAVAGQREREVLDEGAALETLVEVFDLDHHIAQSRAGGDLDFLEVELPGLLRLGDHLLVSLQTSLVLGLPRLGARAHPRELFLQALVQLGVLAPLHGDTLCLLLQVGGVVALIGVGTTTVQLEDPLGHVVQEVSVVSHGQDGTRVSSQVLLKPQHALGVQVVGGLIEQQQVWLRQQQLAQRHPAALATGQVRHRLVRRRAAQRIHRLLQLGVDIPGVRGVQFLLELAHFFHELIGVVGGHQLSDLVVPVELGLDGHAVLDVFAHRLGLVQRRLLLQDPDTGPVGQKRLAIVRLVQTGHDLQDAGLTGAVRADHTNLCAGQEVQGDIVEDHLVAMRLADFHHRVDVLSHAALSPLL